MAHIGCLSGRPRNNKVSGYLGKGSALLLCLVFLSALSALAAGALETARSGQRMITAYIVHQQSFLLLERRLLDAEKRAWQIIESQGLAQFLASPMLSETLPEASTVRTHGDWVSTDFFHLQCGPLFQVRVRPQNDVNSSSAGMSVRWDVCCRSTETCLASEFTQRRRLWTRVTGALDGGDEW